jgi:hypothetical protein
LQLFRVRRGQRALSQLDQDLTSGRGLDVHRPREGWHSRFAMGAQGGANPGATATLASARSWPNAVAAAPPLVGRNRPEGLGVDSGRSPTALPGCPVRPACIGKTGERIGLGLLVDAAAMVPWLFVQSGSLPETTRVSAWVTARPGST